MDSKPGLAVKVVIERHDGKIVKEYSFDSIAHKIIEQFGLLLPNKMVGQQKRDLRLLTALRKASLNVRTELLAIGVKPDTWLL